MTTLGIKPGRLWLNTFSLVRLPWPSPNTLAAPLEAFLNDHFGPWAVAESRVRALLHGQEDTVPGDTGYTGADKRSDLEGCKAAFLIAAKRSKVKASRDARDRKQVERWETGAQRMYGSRP